MPASRRRITSVFAGLFPDSPLRPATRRGVLLALLAVAVGVALSLLRTTGTGPLQSIWEEDARDILDDALNLPGAKAIVTPAVGYFVVGPRLLGELATLFPVSWAAAVLSISSALVTALLALQVYFASGAHLRNQLARVLVAVPLLLSPIAENRLSEVYNRPVCLHFFAMYALFWVLLWSPATRAGRASALVTVGMTAVSTILIVGYLPLALVRVLIRRDRLSIAMLGLLVGGTALHVAGLQLGLASREGVSELRADPGWVLQTLASWALPSSMLGYRATSGLPESLSDNAVVVALAWTAVALIVIAAFVGARRRLLRPAWLLAGVAAVYAVFLYGMMIVANGTLAHRYLIPFELLLFTAFVALLLPARGVDLRRTGPFMASFAVFVVVVAAFNYRWADTHRANAPRWTDQIHQAAVRCAHDPRLAAVIVRGAPKPWWSYVRVPCHQLRPAYVCDPPQCLWLDPPKSLGPVRGWYRP